MIGKLLFLSVAYWWVFVVISALAVIAKTEIYSNMLSYVAKYDGSFWWCFLAVGLAFGVLRLILGACNVQ